MNAFQPHANTESYMLNLREDGIRGAVWGGRGGLPRSAVHVVPDRAILKPREQSTEHISRSGTIPES